MHLIPQQRLVTTHEMCTREAHWTLSPQGFYWGPVTWVPSTEHIPKFQALRRKADVWHKSRCLHKPFRHRVTLIIEGMVGTLPKCKFSDTSLSKPCQQVLGLLGYVFSGRASSPILCFQFMATYCHFQLPG